MNESVKFAVLGDCHYSNDGNYSSRDCSGAKAKVIKILDILNNQDLDFVFSLGDISDGNSEHEAIEMLEAFGTSRHPVKFALGNHDLVAREECEHMKLFNMPAPMYDFSVKGFRFIVLNPFEISRYSRNPEEEEAYWNFRKTNPDLPVQSWPGLFRESSWNRLANMLDDAISKSENVIIFSHVPLWYLACLRPPTEKEPSPRIIEHERMLELLDRYPNVRAFIAGHYHPGGLAVRRGVMHKTVRSVCDYAEETACIVMADKTQIQLVGLGCEKDYLHIYDQTIDGVK